MKRIIPGILLAFGWLLLLAEGSFLLFWAVVLLIGFIGAREFCRMVFPGDFFETDRLIFPVLVCCPILVAAFADQPRFSESFGLFVGFCGLVAFVIYHYQRFENPLHILFRGILGLVFIGFLASHLVLIRAVPEGAHWLIILTAMTAGSDTGAYMAGTLWGRRKLCPVISPKKTVEGGIGGIIGGAAMALLLSMFFRVEASWPIILVLAVILSFVGMVGDLLESVIKRGAGIKDSGRLLAGHGGVLDRVDSLFLASPVLYYILIFFYL